jgi:platelet-activating factor acetylhydrolase IB subunit alpha
MCANNDKRHQSILDYFVENGLFPETVATLKREANISESTDTGSSANSGKGLLEKKWTSVVRLQKKVMYSFACSSIPNRNCLLV